MTGYPDVDPSNPPKSVIPDSKNSGNKHYIGTRFRSKKQFLDSENELTEVLRKMQIYEFLLQNTEEILVFETRQPLTSSVLTVKSSFFCFAYNFNQLVLRAQKRFLGSEKVLKILETNSFISGRNVGARCLSYHKTHPK